MSKQRAGAGRPFVAESKDGWEPSWRVIQLLQSKARKLGLIWDWPTIAVLANHDMLLDCSHVTGENGADLIACKERGRWLFKIDGDYVHEEKVERPVERLPQKKGGARG